MRNGASTSTWGRLGGAVVIVAVVVGVFAAAAGTATGKLDPDKKAQVSVATVDSSVATLADPDTVYDLTFGPESAATFTQEPGEVVTVTMAASFVPEDGDHLFCDLHAAVNLDDGLSDPVPETALRQNWLAQRGDVWWQMTEQGRDLTRTLPAPAVATTHTVVGVAWMDTPLVGEPDCYGTQYGFAPQEVDVSARVSVVKVGP